MSQRTYFVQIVTRGEPMPDYQTFVPWYSCSSVSEACQVAVSQYLREAGYMHARSSRPELELDAYCFPATVERHDNGRPVAIMLQQLKCTPTK